MSDFKLRHFKFSLPKKVSSSFAFNLVTVLFYASLLMGCMTRNDGKQLRNQLHAQNKAQSERLQKLEALMGKVQEQLQVQLNEETQEVRRTTADLGAELDVLKESVASLEGQIAEFSNQLEALRRSMDAQKERLVERITTFAKRAGIDMPVEESQIPDKPEEHFDSATVAFNTSDYSTARGLFRAYIEKYPQDEKADDAQYWIGASYLQQGKPATALGEFRKVISSFRDGDIVDKALLEMANAFLELKACTDAKAALQALTQSYPKSPATNKAKTLLKKIRRLNKSQCTS